MDFPDTDQAVPQPEESAAAPVATTEPAGEAAEPSIEAAEAAPPVEPEPAEAAETLVDPSDPAGHTAEPSTEAAEASAPAEPEPAEPEPEPAGSIEADELLAEEESPVFTVPVADAELKAVLEAIIYVTDEPLTLDQICAGLEQPRERVLNLLEELAADYEQSSRGLTVKEIAGGFKMATKPEHHEAVRRFVKNLNPPLKLSLPALETLAVIAYKQPITAPEIMEIRGVQGAGVLKTLIDRKLIATAGRKAVVGKPILYKTTREFLVQFGLRDLAELPTLKEFQEIGRMDTDSGAPAEAQHTPAYSEPLLFSSQPDDEPAAAEPDLPETESKEVE